VVECESPDVAERLAHFSLIHSSDPDWVRLLEWEALSADPVIGAGERAGIMRKRVDEVRQFQSDGHLSEQLDPEQLFLTFMALTMFPSAFPQLTRQVCGCEPDNPDFQKKRVEFLRTLANLLRPPLALSKDA
jgi:hypothetical protein